MSITLARPSMSRTKKTAIVFLVLLSLVLIGTVVVLSTVSYYLAIPTMAYLTEEEVPWRAEDVIGPLRNSDMPQIRAEHPTIGRFSEEEMTDGDEVEGENGYDEEQQWEDEMWGPDGKGTGGYWMRAGWEGQVQGTDSWQRLFNVTTRPGEKIPRLIHQTWKNDQLPEKWREAWKECREGMPDYEYMLWTDDLSRAFIAEYYPSQLHMFDSYKYPIQRADSIRYFVLNHFGGVYMDLDIGCRRRLDSLLRGDWEVVLPVTKPVGVSNDLILSSKGSAFMDDTVHALSAFNHEYLTNYPTVMFSTGPMFLSAQYAIYSSAHPLTPTRPRAQVRILPKTLYGKNAAPSSVPHSFFSHYYGSSWHSDDAGFITFLGKWGKNLMYLSFIVILIGAIRLVYQRYRSSSNEYQLVSLLPISLPNVGVSLPDTHTTSGTSTPTTPPTSRSTLTSSTSATSEGPFSPTLDLITSDRLPSEIASAFRRAGHLILAAPATLLSRTGRRKTGLLYYVPALFQPTQTSRRGRTASEASQLPLRTPKRQRSDPPSHHYQQPRPTSPSQSSNQYYQTQMKSGGQYDDGSSPSRVRTQRTEAPPPYDPHELQSRQREENKVENDAEEEKDTLLRSVDGLERTTDQSGSHDDWDRSQRWSQDQNTHGDDT
ncbi:hypothetical protein TREMEDRAFT_40831 [Tremella mesenterica DSM 1558]|nr:uncharacterized protein TREMEDRAFT_40831 [Tremella mesenterica DSM 1558]EIW66516.1 hypothetical protein TREMEDRAFT_40831 [Tremella mesenterica DSM 1558]